MEKENELAFLHPFPPFSSFPGINFKVHKQGGSLFIRTAFLNWEGIKRREKADRGREAWSRKKKKNIGNPLL